MGLFDRSDTCGRGVERAEARPVVISRSRQVAAPPSAVFGALSEPSSLAGVLPRVKQVDLLQRGETQARIVTHMQVTPLTVVRAEGEVRWQTDREIVFTTSQPVSVQTRILLSPVEGGTRIDATLTLDLGPMLGPLAAFVPPGQVASAAAPDLDATLAAIARTVERV